MLNKEQASELMGSVVSKIQEVMDIIHLFEDNRPGSIAFTKLEEAIMWINVMTHNVPKRQQPVETKEEVVLANAS